MDLTKELIAYVFFGVLTTIVNFITYFLFEGVFGINYLISNIIAWFVSVLFRDTKPLAFFSIITGILVIIALSYFIPILISYLYTGYVLRIPTLIVTAVTFLVSVMIFLSGVILQVLKKQHDQNFEHYLTQISMKKK